MQALINGIKMALYFNWINNWMRVYATSCEPVKHLIVTPEFNGLSFHDFAIHHNFTLEQAMQVVEQGHILWKATSACRVVSITKGARRHDKSTNI